MIPLLSPHQSMYTVFHQTHKAPLLVHVEDQKTQQFRSFMTCFHREKDALLVATIVESHKKSHGKWPPMEVSANARIELELNVPLPKHDSLEDLYIQQWTYKEVEEFAQENLLHIMYMDNIDEKYVTKMITFQYPASLVRRSLRNYNDM